MDCSNLTNVTIPESVVHIGTHAFTRCDKLLQVENGVFYVGKWAVGSDTSATTATLRENTVGIGGQAFFRNDNLTSVVVPENVKYIVQGAFNNCNNLTSITFKGTIEQWGAVNKETYWKYYVPATSVTCSDGVVSLN